MIGEGGTGKSRVIGAITDFFTKKEVGYKLQKAAYTGIAASLIEGKTTHSIGMITRSKRSRVSGKAHTTLQQYW